MNLCRRVESLCNAIPKRNRRQFQVVTMNTQTQNSGYVRARNKGSQDRGAHNWALVLAAGDGSRLHSLTTTSSGVAIPKQFCSLHGGPTLLQETLQRARSIASGARVCAVFAEQHRAWWQPDVRNLMQENIFVQPSNRGTANGILLPLLHIIARDPDARIVLLPSDHFVHSEDILVASLQHALHKLQAWDGIVLLGISPDEADPDLGYIAPGKVASGRLFKVNQFVEKPSTLRAQELIAAGALWNAFIVVASARSLLNLFNARVPQLVASMQAAVALDESCPNDPIAAKNLYPLLPHIDFSKHLTQGAENSLRVLPVPPCGWSDLGTPKRVTATLQRLPGLRASLNARASVEGPIILAAQHIKLHAGNEWRL
jgi:mannose-1-phosphate guanylyltransferase